MSYVCQVDFYNHLEDGSIVAAVVANFKYSDGTTSQSSDQVANLGYNGATSLFSENKCVHGISALLTVRRPSDQIDNLQGSEPPAPANQCYTRSGFGAEPARMRDLEKSEQRKEQEIVLVLHVPVGS